MFFFSTYADLIEFPWILDSPISMNSWFIIFLNFDFFFYFWHPLLIKIQFKFEFQINRVPKIINIIFFWSIFYPAFPQHTCLKIKKNNPVITAYFFLIFSNWYMYRYYKNSGVGKFCPNSKCPDKSSSGLTRSDCIFILVWLINWFDKAKQLNIYTEAFAPLEAENVVVTERKELFKRHEH